MTAGVSSRADGSAYVESERSKVVAAVYGPRPAKRAEYTERAEIRCDVKLASFARAQARKAPGQTDEEKAWSSSLEQTLEAVVLLEKYPKSLIDVFVLVLEADGSVLASAINAASVALAQGGIEMRDVVTAVTVGMSGIGPVVDLTADDEKSEMKKKKKQNKTKQNKTKEEDEKQSNSLLFSCKLWNDCCCAWKLKCCSSDGTASQ